MKMQDRVFESNRIDVYQTIEQFMKQGTEGLHIVLSMSEKTSFMYDEKKYNLGYGDFFLLNKPLHLGDFKKNTGEVIFIVLQLEGHNQKLLYNKQHLNGNSAISTSSSDIEFKNLLVRLLGEYYNTNRDSTNTINAIYYRMLEIVFTEYFSEENRFFSSDNSKDDELFFQIINYIDENYQHRLTLNEIAQKFYLSSSTLSKFFQKKAGKKFLTYVTERRLNIAEQKIRHTQAPIIQIALDTGFPNVSSFNKAFKEKYQATPAKYRKDCEEKEEEQTDDEFVSTEIEKLISSTNKRTAFYEEYQINVQNGLNGKLSNWKYLVNLGSIESVLQYGFKEQLVDTQKMIGYFYGRVWGLFDEEIISLQTAGAEKINFRKIEKVIDLMLSNDLVPFLEIGDKPFIINRNTNRRVFSNKTGSLPFFENKEWEKILEAFIRFAINRWGKEEVSKWHFELWKTNLTVTLDKDEFMKDGKLYDQETELYIDRFNHVNKILKRFIPKCKLGGCGLSVDLEKPFMERFIKRWGKEIVKPDFFSIYLYPMNSIDEEGSQIENRISPDQTYFSKNLKLVRTILDRGNFKQIPLVVTEWNFSISNRNYLQDSCFKAAFIFKSILDSVEYVDGLGYWLLSDLYGEFNDTHQLIHGGAGLITKDNIKKPAFYAFEFLSQMGSQVIHKTQDLLVTKDEDETIYLLMSNYKHLNQFYFLHDESEISSDFYLNIFEDTLPKEVTIHLKGVDVSNYRIKSQVVNSKNGSLINNISRVGNQRILRQREIDYLRNISVPLFEVELNKTEEDGLTIKNNLIANEIRLVTIEKLV